MKLVTTTGRLEHHFGLKKAIDMLSLAGYDALGRLYAIGYLKGILEAVD